MADHGIATFELVVVNLYPFEATVAKQGVSEEEAIENIDIGGPSLVRAAAKNYAFVTVATSPAQYAEILHQMAAGGGTTLEFRRKLAGEAFAHTAGYDRAIAAYFAEPVPAGSFPDTLSLFAGPKRRVAVRREPAPASGPLCHERRSAGKRRGRQADPRQGAFLQQLARPGQRVGNRLRVHRAGRLGNQAQQSMRRRRGRQPGRSPPLRHGRRPAQRLRFGAGTEPYGRLGHGRSALPTGTVRRGDRGSRFRPGGRGNAHHAAPMEKQCPAHEGRPAGSRTAAACRTVTSAAACSFKRPTSPDEDQSEWKVVTEPAPRPAMWPICDSPWPWCGPSSPTPLVAEDRMLLGAGAGQMSRVDSVEIALKKAGDRAGRRAGHRCLLPLPRFDRAGRQRPISRHIQPGGSVKDAGRDRRLQPAGIADGLHGPAAFQALAPANQ